MKKGSIYIVIGILLSIFVWIDFYWWIITWDGARSFQENLSVYLTRFPRFLQDGTTIQVINLILSALSIYFYLKARKYGAHKVFILVLIIINSLLLLCSLFSLS